MKKQILTKVLWDNDANRILSEYGVRKWKPKPRPVDLEPVMSEAESNETDDEIIATERHIQIVEKTAQRIAAAAACKEPTPEYEIVWRKQDQPGHRRKPFTPPDSMNENNAHFERRRCGDDGGANSPARDETRDRGQNDRAREPLPIPMNADGKPMSRKEREYFENGKKMDSILVVFGPDHFTYHAGSGYRGSRQLYQLENGCVVDGMKEDDDIPQKELTTLEIALNLERKMLEGMDF